MFTTQDRKFAHTIHIELGEEPVMSEPEPVLADYRTLCQCLQQQCQRFHGEAQRHEKRAKKYLEMVWAATALLAVTTIFCVAGWLR